MLSAAFVELEVEGHVVTLDTDWGNLILWRFFK